MSEMRAAGKAVIVNDNGKILVIKRKGEETHLENLWDVPGGRFDYGETPQEGLKRETREEAGLEIEIVEPVRSWTFTRDNGEQVFGTTFLCEPESFDIEIGDEHSEHRWIEPEKLDDIAMHDGLREGLKQAHQKWNEDHELPKLVRDKIPEICRENNDIPTTRLVSGEELEKFSRDKVVEEAEEFGEDGSKDELADLLEVIDTYIENENIDRQEIERIRDEKNSKRGGFSEGIILEDVTSEKN